MGLLARAVERKSDPLSVWAEMLRAGTSSKAGATINLDTAFKVSVLFACLRVISQGVAQVPFKLFREVEEGGLTRIVPAKNHDLYDLVTVATNDWTTSYEFRETQAIHAAMGNSYAFLNRGGMNGKILEAILLDPTKVKKEQREDYSIVYKVTGKSGGVQEFPAEAIWHVKGPSWDGLLGLEVLQVAREALGLAIATEETHAKLHARGVQSSGVYSVDSTLNGDQYRQLKAWIEKEHAGAENSGAPMILDRGAKWVSSVMSGTDSQHLETRNLQIEEVCRFMGVMPIMVGYSDKAATYASAEQMFLAHVIHCLSPWYARIEASANLNLLSKRERKGGYYLKHVAAGLLRGDSKARAEYFAKALGSGGGKPWMCQDEVRALEELNPFGGEASQLPKPPEPAAQTPGANTNDD